MSLRCIICFIAKTGDAVRHIARYGRHINIARLFLPNNFRQLYYGRFTPPVEQNAQLQMKDLIGHDKTDPHLPAPSIRSPLHVAVLGPRLSEYLMLKLQDVNFLLDIGYEQQQTQLFEELYVTYTRHTITVTHCFTDH